MYYKYAGYEHLDWETVYDAACNGRDLPNWHEDMFHWVMAAEEDTIYDLFHIEGIDYTEMPKAEFQERCFCYLSNLLAGEMLDAETAAIARKFFKSLGVSW